MFDTRPDPEAISGLLPGHTMFGPIRVVDSTGSTNSDLAQAARAGAAPGQVLIAREQTSGRGRLARQWVSPAGRSVSLSVLLAPRAEPKDWGWLSLLTGLAVRAALAGLAPAGVQVTLKWPNDVLIDGRKVCGILSERLEQQGRALAVVGLGINLTLTEEQLPVPNATSLAIAGYSTNANDVVAGVLNAFERYYRKWEASSTLRDDYLAQCSSIGAELTITPTGGAPLPGVGHGIAADGSLEVRTADGIRSFAVGDVVHARLA
ncbi:biotin--[acetyl-CoA-carboxylase] ligase [Tessaracoccus sp. OH4464_COT-324]|uniref:biotin--[acetyl-CoA-carboxylase] ligase n=1 Tax=Tessaracoccus sp. OH4464_COT-324 TaxID=2491059 RepID=UPI000F6338CC|nr:biotin--[acetyl-CoA-carboxylase] ligase [Tessaracoccus sp. OH4464_COT-324]RRD46794.1 biotin--[acetyl-CoA-carboxylase] ligase [Tessaracoccus sp. OH4464_COT-324]